MPIPSMRRILVLIFSAAIVLALVSCTKQGATSDAGVSLPASQPQQADVTATDNNENITKVTEGENIETQASPAADSLLVQVGELVHLGGFYWWVLDVQDGKALIITENIIENRAYNTETGSETTWSECDLREYLNGEFFDSFNKQERQMIVQTEIKNPDNQWYGTDGGSDTADYIFLLSLDEVVRYFGDSGQLNSRVSDSPHIDDTFNSAWVALHVGGTYTDSASGYTHTVNSGEAWGWWLRSPGAFNQFAATVSVDGCVIMYGVNTHLVDAGGVRPALWLKI